MSRWCLWFTVLLFSVNPVCGKQSEFAYAGGVVELQLPKTSSQLPQVRFGTREPVVIEQADHWRVLIGIQLDTPPGEYLVYVKPSDENDLTQFIRFTTRQFSYPLHQIEQLNVNSPILETSRASAVRKQSSTSSNVIRPPVKLSTITPLSAVHFSNSQTPELPLHLPTNADWSPSFGNRYLSDSGQLLMFDYVSYTTQSMGTINAPQQGIVINIVAHNEDSNETATTYDIVLDHGRGLISILRGLGEPSVQLGDGVIAGAMIGRTPDSTSEDSPSTIYWQTMLNSALVNPLILTKLRPSQP